jgi:hypothetical protein
MLATTSREKRVIVVRLIFLPFFARLAADKGVASTWTGVDG